MRRLRAVYPDATCSLRYDTPWQLLVATILSAQCTDERVNEVTPALFARFPTPEAMAGATLAELEELVRPTGFFRMKARSLAGAALHVLEHHGGEVPRSTEELVRVPGAGRKTAAVVLGHAYGVAEGIAVDTHAGRISRRLGLIESEDPVRAERELMAIVPRRSWVEWTDLLIAHGRAVCSARTAPRCDACVLLDICPTGRRRAREARASARAPRGTPRAR